MIDVVKYSENKSQEWDGFIANSRNGTFMLMRRYVEYHKDRFEDFSLLFYDGDKLVALMPASRHGDEVRSHGGLTYGGIIIDREMTASRMLDVFCALKQYLKYNGVQRLIYKRIPSIYYSYPSDEDLYALFRNGANLVRRDISIAIDLLDPIPFSTVRSRYAKKARKEGIVVRESNDYVSYVNLLTDVLMSYHNTKPTHSAEELRLLASNFPDAIKLFCAYKGDAMLAGVLIFETPSVVHTQYIANSEEGRCCGALDLVMDYLIHEYSARKRYFDFGICTENNGLFLNEGLVRQKEMFGGRGVAYDFYELSVNDSGNSTI